MMTVQQRLTEASTPLFLAGPLNPCSQDKTELLYSHVQNTHPVGKGTSLVNIRWVL